MPGRGSMAGDESLSEDIVQAGSQNLLAAAAAFALISDRKTLRPQ